MTKGYPTSPGAKKRLGGEKADLKFKSHCLVLGAPAGPAAIVFPQACFVVLKITVKSLSRVRLFGTSWTVAYQAPPSMGFFRQEYWSGLPFPSPGDLPDSGIEPGSSAL